jgi:hypothetical protein
MVHNNPRIGEAASKLQNGLTPELKEKERREKANRARQEKDGDAPMSGEQASRLKAVAREKGMQEAYDSRLSKSGAEQRISIIAGKKEDAGPWGKVKRALWKALS